MSFNTRYYPITTRLRDQAGNPIVGQTNVYLRALALDGQGDPSASLAVDLGLDPPNVVTGAPVKEKEVMEDLRRREEKEIVLSSTETDLERLYIDRDTFRAEVQVVDETKVVALNQVTATKVPIDTPMLGDAGVKIVNVTQSTILIEGTHFAVNYVSGLITFVTGVNNGDTVELDYWWLAEEGWFQHEDEAQTVGPTGGFSSGQIVLDAVPLDSWPVTIRNVTQAEDLVEGTHFTVNYGTGLITFLGGSAVDDDEVEATYTQLDPASDYWVNYNTGIFTRLTLGDDNVAFRIEYIWVPGTYVFYLDVSQLPDGRYLVVIEWTDGTLVRVGQDDFIVRDGAVLDDFLGNQLGTGIRRVRIKTRENTDDQEIIGDVLVSVFDSAGDQVILQARTGADSGDVVLALPEGSFEAIAFRSLVTFTNPTAFTVTDSAQEQVVTLLGTLLASPPAGSVSPECCLVYGNVSLLNCDPAISWTIRAQLRDPPSVRGSSVIANREVCTATEANGDFSIPLVRGQWVTFSIQETGYEEARLVPEAASVFFNDMESP